MKHIIILGDGMADHPVERLGGLTPLQYADTPALDTLAREGRCGMLATIPPGFHPGSEVANTAILGYDLDKVYEGRGPLEAASIGYEMQPDDLALRCNMLTLADGKIKNHHGGHLPTDVADQLIHLLNERLADERVRFYTGTQYRHLLVIKGGNKHIKCTPPHDHPGEEWKPLLVKADTSHDTGDDRRLTSSETAEIINRLILESQKILSEYWRQQGCDPEQHANTIWPWGGGYRPAMETLAERYPQIKSGAVISAVDLIKGIGHYAGLKIIKVEGATGLADTNYAGKVDAAIDALRNTDFVFLHVEASDEAGHDGDLKLKLRTISDLDSKVVAPILKECTDGVFAGEEVCIAVLPDHPTPVEMRVHVSEPVPFAIWHKGIKPDSTAAFSENDCSKGAYGLLHMAQFIDKLMQI